MFVEVTACHISVVFWDSVYPYVRLYDNIQIMHGNEIGIEIWWTGSWKCRTRAQLECVIFNRGWSYFNATLTTVYSLYIIICISSSETAAKREWVSSAIYTVSQKKQDTKLLPITSPDVNRFLKFFHCQTQWQICNKFMFKYPTTP